MSIVFIALTVALVALLSVAMTRLSASWRSAGSSIDAVLASLDSPGDAIVVAARRANTTV